MTTACPALPASVAPGEAPPKRRLPVLSVAALLNEQQSLTAVERFAKLHEDPASSLKERIYRDLVPLERPQAGEQYAFEVDLDACTGCKACVAACHNMNGLDPGELWRNVGLLHGGSAAAPAVRTVTSSCHHCLEPACLLGCPTRAYEKDPVTGIVKHLDDQCFGCEYCTLMCPYDAPKYNRARGIVRKCDMCSARLASGEAPACVQACPNEAIAIRIVEQAAVIENADAHHFLPGAPAPDQTLPTTVYKSQRPMPGNLLPADFYTTRPEHGHPPLVVMLTLTQLSAGAFALDLLVDRLSGAPAGDPLAQTLVATSLALLALAASVFHLGRPWLAWRAVLGLRTSWLSREAVAFGLFAKLAIAYGLLRALPLFGFDALGSQLLPLARRLHEAAALLGLVGVSCSVMVYVATRREQWSATHTGVRFFGTTILLGAAAVFAVSALTTAAPGASGVIPTALLGLIAVTATLKAAFELRALGHRSDRRHSALKRVATVMLGDLRALTALRFAALSAGVVLPTLLLLGDLGATAVGVISVLMLVLLTFAELLERYAFFRAAPASRMPGALK